MIYIIIVSEELNTEFGGLKLGLSKAIYKSI